jgi:ribosomal protein S18 acetylase RimI-like enzyme
MEYKIRKKERKDCAEVAHVVTVAWNETYKGIVPDEFLKGLYLNEEQRANDAYNSFDESDNHQYVLEVDGKVVGFVNVGVTDEKDYDNCGELYAIYILNGYKGNGYGKELIKIGIEELKQMGFTKMIIGCLDGNPSNEFYKHLGGKFVKTRIFEKLNLPENVYIFEKI